MQQNVYKEKKLHKTFNNNDADIIVRNDHKFYLKCIGEGNKSCLININIQEETKFGDWLSFYIILCIITVPLTIIAAIIALFIILMPIGVVLIIFYFIFYKYPKKLINKLCNKKSKTSNNDIELEQSSNNNEDEPVSSSIDNV